MSEISDWITESEEFSRKIEENTECGKELQNLIKESNAVSKIEDNIVLDNVNENMKDYDKLIEYFEDDFNPAILETLKNIKKCFNTSVVFGIAEDAINYNNEAKLVNEPEVDSCKIVTEDLEAVNKIINSNITEGINLELSNSELIKTNKGSEKLVFTFNI